MTVLCRVMKVSTSAYYAWNKGPEFSAKAKENEKLNAKIRGIFDDHKQTYGSRRIVNELKNQGIRVGRYKVRKLMAQMDLHVRYPKRFRVTTDVIIMMLFLPIPLIAISMSQHLTKSGQLI